jgi:hypothetical protein
MAVSSSLVTAALGKFPTQSEEESAPPSRSERIDIVCHILVRFSGVDDKRLHLARRTR